MTLDPETRREVASFLRTVLRTDPIPGLSVAVVDADETTYADGFGSRDLAGNRPATAETLYGVGSVTKSFTALSVLQLAEGGLLSVDDPVTDHLDASVGDADDPVTLHHLLTHTSGYPSLGVSETLLARRLRHPDAGVPLGDHDDFYAHVADAADERTDPPGERFSYCNSGYALVGEVVEESTGKPFPEYVDGHVFDPVGMERATFDDREFARDDDHMTQYLVDDGEFVAASLPTRELGHATGGILAPVTELADYLRAHLSGGVVDGTRLVSEESLDRMHAGYAETPHGAYGYGWFREEVCGRTLVGHSGSIGVSSAYVGFSPEDGVGVALAANSSPSYSLGVVGHGVFATLLGRNPHEAVPFFHRRKVHEELVGEYESYRGVLQARVIEDGNALRAEFDGPFGPADTPLFPVPDGGDHEFYALTESGDRKPAEFRVDGDDTSLLFDRWRLHQIA